MRFISFVLFFFAFLPLSYSQTIQSKYFNVSCEGRCDLFEFAQKINVNYFLHLDKITIAENNIESIIAKALDALYLEVSDILDIHLLSYKGKIKIFPTKSALKNFLLSLKIDVDTPSIYIYPHNTIYISLEDLTASILAHEIAHAIISKYFVVVPSEKIQEILAGYVEYSIKKMVR